MKRTIEIEIPDTMTLEEITGNHDGCRATPNHFDSIFKLNDYADLSRSIETPGDIQDIRYLLERDRTLFKGEETEVDALTDLLQFVVDAKKFLTTQEMAKLDLLLNFANDYPKLHKTFMIIHFSE